MEQKNHIAEFQNNTTYKKNKNNAWNLKLSMRKKDQTPIIAAASTLVLVVIVIIIVLIILLIIK
jgi:fumarate reductase subunit C